MLSATDDQLAGARPRSRLRDGLVNLAIHDWIVLAYAVVLNVAVALAPSGPVKDHCLLRVGTLLTLLVTMLLRARPFVKDGFSRPFRIASSLRRCRFPTSSSASSCHSSIPARSTRPITSVSAFGAEPALALDAVVNQKQHGVVRVFLLWLLFPCWHARLADSIRQSRRGTMSDSASAWSSCLHRPHPLHARPGYGPFGPSRASFKRVARGLWLDV